MAAVVVFVGGDLCAGADDERRKPDRGASRTRFVATRPGSAATKSS